LPAARFYSLESPLTFTRSDRCVILFQGREKLLMHQAESTNTDAAILARILQPDQPWLTPEVARSFLSMHFPERDLGRMRELLGKNQAGELTAEDQRELEAYLRVGRFLDLVAAKARLTLHQRGLGA
jgi:hypothetical protein